MVGSVITDKIICSLRNSNQLVWCFLSACIHVFFFVHYQQGELKFALEHAVFSICSCLSIWF